MEKIIAKEYCLEHFTGYPFGMKNQKEMLALLNILQAGNETLDSMHDVVCNGYDRFMDIFGRWDSDKDLYHSLLDFNTFYTEDEFIEFIKEQMIELKENGFDDPVEEIRTWTDENEVSDTKIIRTEDGYVVRVWY